MSISKSFELTYYTIEAVAVAQEELFPVLSQLKSISFELLIVLNVACKRCDRLHQTLKRYYYST